jgi:hypothetical protein
MIEPGDPDWDESVHSFRRAFATNLADAVGERQMVTLMWPSLEFVGRSAAGYDIAMTSWRVSIGMYVNEFNSDDERRLDIGFVDLLTLPLDEGALEALDAVSEDTAAYLALFSGGIVSAEIAEQFDNCFMSGLLILDRAYVHPALRRLDLGAWAVVQAIHDLTFGSSEVLVVAYPVPIDRRPGVTAEAGAELLAQHWTKAGFESIEACPKLVGLSTKGEAYANARLALAEVADTQTTLAIPDLDIF